MGMLDKIDRLRVRRGLTQAALERTAGLAENRISKWRNAADPDPRAREVLRIARVLGVSVDYLLDDEMEKPPAPPEELSEAETEAVATIRALQLDRQEVIRGLHAAVAVRTGDAEAAFRVLSPPRESPRPKRPHPNTG